MTVDTRVDESPLPFTAKRCLEVGGLHTKSEVARALADGPGVLLSIPGLGRKTLNEIMEWIADDRVEPLNKRRLRGVEYGIDRWQRGLWDDYALNRIVDTLNRPVEEELPLAAQPDTAPPPDRPATPKPGPGSA